MKQIKLMFGLGVFLCFMTGTAWAAHDIMISTLDENRAPKTEFQCGDTLVVSVDLDLVSADERVAGFAFTLEYPDAVVSPPSMGTDGLPVNADDISSTFPFLSGSTKTYRAGNVQTGRLSLSAAEVDVNSGGAVAHDDDARLFTVVFSVKSNAPEGNHQFSLIPTTLNNSDAGWNGEASPVLVGAVPQGDGAFDDLANGAFPELFAPLAGTTIDMASISISECANEFPNCTSGLNGDFNSDGNVNVFDAINTYLVGTGDKDISEMQCNCDLAEPFNTVNVFDAIRVYTCGTGTNPCN